MVGGDNDMGTEENEAAASRFLNAVIVGGDIDVVDELLALTT
jgi:hypothetical protein